MSRRQRQSGYVRRYVQTLINGVSSIVSMLVVAAFILYLLGL